MQYTCKISCTHLRTATRINHNLHAPSPDLMSKIIGLSNFQKQETLWTKGACFQGEVSFTSKTANSWVSKSAVQSSEGQGLIINYIHPHMDQSVVKDHGSQKGGPKSNGNACSNHRIQLAFTHTCSVVNVGPSRQCPETGSHVDQYAAFDPIGMLYMSG